MVIPSLRYCSTLGRERSFCTGVLYSLYTFLILPFGKSMSSGNAQNRW